MASLYDDILYYLYDHQQQEKELYEQFESKHKREAIKASAEELYKKGLINRRFGAPGLNMSFHGGKRGKTISTPSSPKLFAQIKDAGILRVDEQNAKAEELKLKRNPPPARPHNITIIFAWVMAGVAVLSLMSTYILHPTFRAWVNGKFTKEIIIPPAIDLTKDTFGFTLYSTTGAGREGYPESIPTFLLTVENKNSNAKEVKIRYALFREMIWNLEGSDKRFVARAFVTDSSQLDFNYDKWRAGEKKQRKVKLTTTFEEIHMYGFYVASIGQLVDETDTVRSVFTIHKFSRLHNKYGDYRMIETPVNAWETTEVRTWMNRYIP